MCNGDITLCDAGCRWMCHCRLCHNFYFSDLLFVVSFLLRPASTPILGALRKCFASFQTLLQAFLDVLSYSTYVQRLCRGDFKSHEMEGRLEHRVGRIVGLAPIVEPRGAVVRIRVSAPVKME